MRHFITFFLVASTILIASNVSAIEYKLDFSVSSFTGDPPAPYSPVSGSFEFEAASISAPINSLTSVDLTIGTFVYDLSTVAFSRDSSLNRNIFEGALNANAVFPGTDDFFLVWDYSTLDPVVFLYGTSGDYDENWASFQFDIFSITPSAAPIPEPSTFLLLGGGLAGLAFVVRRRKKE